MAKARTSVFFCQNCGFESAKWMGQCPGCREWNTFVEEPVKPSRTASLSFRLSDLASFDEKRICFFLEGGDYILRLGTSSADTRPCGIVRLSGDAVTRKVRRCAGRVTVTDWKPEKAHPAEKHHFLRVLKVDAGEIPT